MKRRFFMGLLIMGILLTSLFSFAMIRALVVREPWGPTLYTRWGSAILHFADYTEAPRSWGTVLVRDICPSLRADGIHTLTLKIHCGYRVIAPSLLICK